MDNKENVRKLVLLYQQHPCLYVTKCADYHNRTKREQALQIICNQYKEVTGQSLTTEVAKKKINNLRSQYLDYLNKIKQSKTSGASTDDVYKPTWWLFEDMSFLDAHIAQRKGESSITVSNDKFKLLLYIYTLNLINFNYNPVGNIPRIITFIYNLDNNCRK